MKLMKDLNLGGGILIKRSSLTVTGDFIQTGGSIIANGGINCGRRC